MMLFYPMLTSTSVSKNITLAICKTLEKYLLLYKTDEILQLANQNLSKGDRIIKAGKGFSLKESLEEIQEVEYKGKSKLLLDSRVNEKSKLSLKPIEDPEFSDYETGKRVGAEDERNKQKKEKQPDKGAKIDLPFKDSFSIEPTYMQVETPTEKQVIGIKVIPYPVKSEGDLVELLLNDRYAPLLIKWLQTFYRAVIRLGWAILRGIRVVPFLSRRPVTGKAVPDIIHAATKHAQHIFVLLNQTDIDKSDFLDEPRNVHRLFKQGWTSFVIADDVNQRASFCMQGFIQSGFCTEVNYSYLLASLGTEKLQIYTDLEDLQKKASPFFRLKRPKKKVFEGCSNKTNKNVVTERQLILEDIAGFSKKADKLFASIQQNVKKNNMSSMKKLITTIPKATLSTIETISRKSSPNFDNSYKLCQSVLKNSTNLSDDKLKAISIIVAFKSTYKITDYKSETKKNLLKTTAVIRKTKEVGETGFLKVLFSVAFTLGIILGSGALSITIFLLLVPLILG